MKVLKKITIALLMIHVITIYSGSSSASSSSSEKPRNEVEFRYVTYSHGWGERGPWNAHSFLSSRAGNTIQTNLETPLFAEVIGPTYPQGRLDFTFYGKAAVLTLINDLKFNLHQNKHLKGEDVIYLVGRSCGSGTILNALALLHNYEEFTDYFEDTGITKDDAQNIIDAINRGKVELTVPMLSLDKTVLFQQASNLFAKMTLFIGSLIVASQVARALGKSPTWLQTGCFGALGVAATSCLFGDMLKRRWAGAIDKTILPIISRGTYDPEHLKPIEAYKHLKGKLKCPVIIQVCQSDGVVDNTIDDIAKLYLDLREGNEDNTSLYVSKGNACHNVPCPIYNKARLDETQQIFPRPKSTEEVKQLFVD